MPSLKRKRASSTRPPRKTASSHSSPFSTQAQIIFWPIVMLTLILWVLYRSLFNYPVWFDETIGKAIFFGIPVWLYVTMSKMVVIPDSFALAKLKPGLLQGIAYGGLFGFVASIASIGSSADQVQAALLFTSNAFWWEFFLALMTGFWETLFFFSFVMSVIMTWKQSWSLINQVLLTSLVFIVFHVPNILTLFSGGYVFGYIVLLWAFSVGQAFIYARNKNAYALVLSHAIWGMVLLVHVAQ